MTINTQVTLSGPYSGNGSTTVFAFNFKVLDESAVRVILTGASGVETVQTLTTHYTVSGVGNASGSVTMLTAPATGTTLTIDLNQPMSQSSDYQTEGDFDAEEVETDLDRSALRDQTLQGLIDRSLQLPASDGTFSNSLPTRANRTNKALFFDDNGDPVAQALSSATVLEGSQPDFDTRSSVLTTTIDASVTHFRTAGYTTRGDGGGALYVRVASEPAHSGKVQSADGSHWEQVPEFGVISPTAPNYAASGTIWADTNSSDVTYKVRGASAFRNAYQLDDTAGIVRVAIDADGDTYISSGTDDEIMFRAGGADVLKVTSTGIAFETTAARDSTRAELGVSPTITNKSTAYTALAADRGKVIRCTAALTLSLTAAATLGSDWSVWVIADGGDVTVDPDGSETIAGAATLTVSDGQSVKVFCDGSNFFIMRGKGGSSDATARVWVRYELDTSVVIDGSFNVSSITRDSAGNADFGVTNAFSTVNDFAGTGSARQDDTSGAPGAGNALLILAVRPETTAIINVVTGSNSTNAIDGDLCMMTAHGNLA